jgi:ABC-type glycerol-3-phosphate transport system permease component
MALGKLTRAEIAKHGVILFILMFAFYPLYLMFVISFKDNTQFLLSPLGWTFPLQLENWRVAWDIVGGYIANSTVVSVSATALTLACSLLSAYVFARYTFPGARALWYALLCLMLLPAVANLVPLFFTLRALKLLNTHTALVLVGAAGGQVVCIYLLRNFIEEIPVDLFDAAEVDGAGFLKQIAHVVVPMCGPILGTLAILQFLGNWNNFVLPMIVLRDASMYTIPVGLMMLSGEYDKHWGQLMAGYMISSIPLVIIFVFTMRLFVRGLGSGAVKG